MKKLYEIWIEESSTLSSYPLTHLLSVWHFPNGRRDVVSTDKKILKRTIQRLKNSTIGYNFEIREKDITLC